MCAKGGTRGCWLPSAESDPWAEVTRGSVSLISEAQGKTAGQTGALWRGGPFLAHISAEGAGGSKPAWGTEHDYGDLG